MTTILRTHDFPTSRPADGEAAAKLFWLSRLDGDIHKASIVPDRKRTSQGQRIYHSVPFALEPEVIRALKSPDVTQGVSDVVLCTSLVAVLLAQYHREDELMLGLSLPAAGAPLVPLRITAAPQASISSVMTALATEIAEVSAWSAASISQLENVLGVAGGCRSAFFDIAVAVGAQGTGIDTDAHPVDIAFIFNAGGGNIHGHVMFAAELYDDHSIDRLVAQLLNAARQVSERPAARLRDVSILPAHERTRILVEFKGRAVDFEVNATIHALFERQVRRAPAAIAAIHGSEQLNYAQLNQRANQVAHSLLKHGLTKGAFVGILLHRSCDFLVAVLGVFKAGGAYVPLDPTYPRDRIRYMVDDSKAPFAITDAALLAEFSEVFDAAADLRVVLSLRGSNTPAVIGSNGVKIIGADALAAAAGDDPNLELVGTDRAYMIYTSGSSGRPKGAICRHDGALNHLFGELDGIGVEEWYIKN